MKATISALVGLMLLATPAAVQAQFGCMTNANNTLTITNYTGSGGAVTIPTNINGLTVSGIDYPAFYKNSTLTEITIPDTVNTIGSIAFQGCLDLTNATLANGLTNIAASAFQGCASLTSLTIPASVTFIGDEAFAGCTSLANVYFPASAPYVISDSFDGDPASVYYLPCTGGWSSSFAGLPTVPWWEVLLSYTTNAGAITITGCSGLCGTEAMALPATINGLPVTSIGPSSFVNFTNLISVTIPDSVTSVGIDAFEDCLSLTSVYFNSNAPAADVSAFDGDTNATVYYLFDTTGWSSPFGGLPAVSASPQAQFNFTTNAGIITLTGYTGPSGPAVIPDVINGLPVTSIAENAFSGNANLTSMTIPYGVTSIGIDAFEDCLSMTNVTIPDSVTSIGANANSGGLAFANSGLINVTIPASVTSIAYGSFFGCSNLTSVTISNGVTGIGETAFYGCTNLREITIPASVSSIGLYAFEDCSSLTAITVDTNNSAYSSVNGVVFNKTQTTLVEYPGGLVGSYTVPSTVTNIAEFSFTFCANLTSVMIPGSVTSIGESAFVGCARLASVYFEGNPPTVPDPSDIFVYPAFQGDNNTTAYYLPGTTGWSNPFAGLPAFLWNPLIQASGANFGMKNNHFGFNITGTANIPIAVQGCTNLASPVWMSLTNVNLTNGLFYFSEPFQANTPARYYRISSP